MSGCFFSETLCIGYLAYSTKEESAKTINMTHVLNVNQVCQGVSQSVDVSKMWVVFHRAWTGVKSAASVDSITRIS